LTPAACATSVTVVEACVVDCGVRAVIAAPSVSQLRAFVRRFTAWCGSTHIVWRARFRAAALRPDAVVAARRHILQMRLAASEEIMISTSSKARGAAAARKLASIVRHVDRTVDHALGADETAARVRRYVGEHDAPADDRTAYARLCVVVFAQGIGYDIVMGKLSAMRAAFAQFDPASVSAFDDAQVESLLQAPIIRNAAKIRACVENARRWVALAEKHGSNLGRIASIAAVDDPTAGWPSLANVVREDFAHVGEAAARQTLKRWGFFTAFAHPGVRRCVERLGLIDKSAEPAALQRLVGSAAHRLGRDPYAVEAALALFASAGPCKPTPKCGECGLADRCPSSVAPS